MRPVENRAQNGGITRNLSEKLKTAKRICLKQDERRNRFIVFHDSGLWNPKQGLH